MNIAKKNLTDSKLELTISLNQDEIKHAHQHELQLQAKKVKVAGFRAGKAPLAIVEKNIDQQQLQASVINHAINDFYGQALDQEQLRPLGQPEVSVTKFVPYSELEFTATVETLPPVELADYTKFKKQVPKVSVSAKEVDEVLNNLLQRSATKKEADRAAKNGDEVVIDFEGTDAKGKAVAGASGTDYPLVLGSNSFIPGFEEGLVGVKTGDENDLQLAFPKDYHAKHLAGTKITFKTTVKKVQEVVLPKADDAFAKSVGPFKSIDELKADIKKQLTAQKEREALSKVKDEIVEELVKKSTFTLPETLVSDQTELLKQDFIQNLVYRGITLNEYLEQEKFKDEATWLEKEIKPQAERRVGVGIVLSQVADKERIQVTQEELEGTLSQYRQQYQQQSGQFDTAELQREVSSRILTEKTVDRLVEIATK
jgi:trigger factor